MLAACSDGVHAASGAPWSSSAGISATRFRFRRYVQRHVRCHRRQRERFASCRGRDMWSVSSPRASRPWLGGPSGRSLSRRPAAVAVACLSPGLKWTEIPMRSRVLLSNTRQDNPRRHRLVFSGRWDVRLVTTREQGAAPRCYTGCAMPTRRPRITITETPEVARRLNLMAARMPQLARSRGALLLALTELGERALTEPATHGDDDRERAKQFILGYTADVTPERAAATLDARENDWHHELY